MKPSLQKLQKFFKLEAERGYDNHAVLGGLDRMLDRWEAEARADDLPEDLIQAVTSRIRDYPRLTPASRAEILEGLLRRIQRSEGPGSEPGRKPAEELRSGERAPARPTPSEPRKGEKPAAFPPAQPPAAPPLSQPAPNIAPTRPAPQPPIAETADEDDAGFEGEEETPVRPRTALPAVPPVDPAALNAPVTVLPGVGPRLGQTLARLGLNSLRDMLYFFPRRYDDYTQLKPINRLWYGEEVTVIATVQSVNVRPLKNGRMQVIEAIVSDGTGALRVSWFNQAWIAKRLHKGAHIVLSGKIDQYLGRLVMNSPEWEPLEQQQLSTNRIVPVYPLTAQITQRWLRRLMNQVISYWAPRVPDPLPASMRQAAGLMDLPTALFQAHFPDSWEDLKAARHRMAFDEIFMLQFGVFRQKRAWQDRPGRTFPVEDNWLQDQVDRLPYALTAAQQRAINDIRLDLASGRPMNRLIQGDVGSGKTIVAAMAVAMLTRSGAQAALMAPTSILAEQHYKSLLRILAGQEPEPALPVSGSNQEGEPTTEARVDTVGVFPISTFSPEPPAAQMTAPVLQPEQIRLMVGSTPEAEKREIREGLASGEIKLIIGTHALIEDPVTFADLQLAIVDEQHRFGVEQRAALRQKGENPHLLVMTATPIPRSLALTVYGDLDLSVIDEMPPGRQPVSTHVLPPRERERAYNLIRSHAAEGRQTFIIYPLVEEGEKAEDGAAGSSENGNGGKAAVEEHARLQKDIFPRLKLGLLHGRLKPDEKDEVMRRFRDGEFQILVSTSVIEVGVDVPNATVMLIEGANRFGLAQLHQFRGRVGRGSEKSYCLLIPETPDAVENERLQVMAETNDGFVLAERDLDQRGPGQFLGTRQSGYSELQLANLTDIQLVEKARRYAQALFDTDPDLQRSEHQLLALALQRFWGEGRGDIS